jgi:hypothetical protein
MAHTFEPELQGEPPRAVPPELFDSPVTRGRRRTVVACLTIGVLCVLLSFLPIVQRWGLFVLPLAYLHWIGGVVILVSLGSVVFHFFNRGPYRYVEDGVAIPARLIDIRVQPTAYHHGQTVGFKYAAAVEFTHPDTGDVTETEVLSDQIAAGFIDQYEFTHKVGDTMSLVYLPGRFDKTRRLYSFLNLRTDTGLIRKDKSVEAGGSAVKNVLIVAGVFGFIFTLCWNLYAMGRYRPIEWLTVSQGVVFGIGGVLLGGAMLWSVIRGQRTQRAKIIAQNEAALATGGAIQSVPKSGGFSGWFLILFAAFGAMLLGGLTFLCWCWTLNAWLDGSPRQPRPVILTDRIQTTHKGIVRTYEIKYRFVDEQGRELHEYATDPDEMARLSGPVGVADLRAGRFGWQWLNAIEPVAIEPPGE